MKYVFVIQNKRYVPTYKCFVFLTSSYAAWLRNVIHNPEIMALQKIECCTYDLARKFTIICDVMMDIDHSIDISFPDGGNCLLAASSNQSIEVCKIILDRASADQFMLVIPVKEYEGCSALHLLVVNQLHEIIIKYMEKLDKADRLTMLNTHIVGSHFLKKMKTS